MHNAILFSIADKNVVVGMSDDLVLSSHMLVLDRGSPIPCDKLVFCSVVAEETRVQFMAVSRGIVLLENGDSTSVFKLYKSGVLQENLKVLLECTTLNTQK